MQRIRTGQIFGIHPAPLPNTLKPTDPLMKNNPIPPVALDKHIAFLGSTGSGKTTAAKSAIVEGALSRKERVLIIDPTGAWWGLRLSANGKKPAFDIPIFGGRHADYPLRAQDATILGEAFATSSTSAIFDTSDMDESEQLWFAQFVKALYRKNHLPLQLVIDEAHLFMPQAGSRTGGNAPIALHAGNKLMSGGRSRGFRISLLSQRPAKLHKDALSQVQTLVAMRVMIPHDREAVGEWMEGQGDRAKVKEIIASLAGLKPGEGWIWSPAANFLERSMFSMPDTFDSGKAPDMGAEEMPSLDPINLDALKERLATVEAEVKAKDPVALNARIRQLEQALKNIPATGPTVVEIDDLLKKGYDHGYAVGIDHANDVAVGVFKKIGEEVAVQIANFSHKNAVQSVTLTATSFIPEKRNVPIVERKGTFVNRSLSPDLSLPEGERKVITAAAQNGSVGASREEISILTGFKRSTRDAYIQRAATKGYLATGSSIIATQEGVDALGEGFKPLPTGSDLRDYWYERLPEGEKKILSRCILRFPAPVDRETLSNETGFKRSTRDAYIQRLTTRRLVIPVGQGRIQASDHLF